MSQDSGSWSVRRQRETSAAMNLNSSSAIPQPTSVMKRTNTGSSLGGSHARPVSGPRHSFAPARSSQSLFSRSSSGTSLADKRASYQSSRPPGNTSTSDGERRNSAYPPRPSTAGPASHLSFFQTGPQTSGTPRDPRPLRDRSYQSRIGQELLDYLAQHNFDVDMKYTLSNNVIKSPTQKDFNYMFQWLYHRIDPSYRFAKGMEHEVPHILKQLKYPYERTITKSQIAAVGGQNWGTFLGLLHWLMQLTQMLEGYVAHQYDSACLENGLDINGDRIMFEFLSRGYRDWLNMDDDAGDDEVEKVLAPHVDAMARAFEHANAQYVTELEILEAEKMRLDKEIEDIHGATPDPAVLDNHFRIMEEDRAKFEQYNSAATQRSEKYRNRIKVLEEELEKLIIEIQAADDERRGLQGVVDDQGISMQDIDRMTAERERLQRGSEAAAQRLSDIKLKMVDKEAEATHKLDELGRMIDMHNTLAYQIGLIPSTAANANGNDYELRVMVGDVSGFGVSQEHQQRQHGGQHLLADAGSGYQPSHVLNLDLRGKIKHEFMGLRKDISERRGVAMDMMMKDHELLDGIKEAIEDKRNEIEALEHRVRAAEAEYENTKEITMAQKHASDTQIEKMEKELSKMRTGISETVQLMDQREMNTSIEYEQLVLRANSLREELHTEIDRMLNDVIKFKIHIQKNLGEYENFVIDELQQELVSGNDLQEGTYGK